MAVIPRIFHVIYTSMFNILYFFCGLSKKYLFQLNPKTQIFSPYFHTIITMTAPGVQFIQVKFTKISYIGILSNSQRQFSLYSIILMSTRFCVKLMEMK